MIGSSSLLRIQYLRTVLRAKSLFVVVLMCLGMLILSGCGGTSSGPRIPEEGRIFLKNETSYPLDVSYSHGETDVSGIVFAPNETKEVTQTTLSGGTEVDIVASARIGDTKPTAKIKIVIDGNVTIRITRASYAGQVEYQISRG